MMSKMALIIFFVSIPFWGFLVKWMMVQCFNPEIWHKKRRFIIFPLFMLISSIGGGFDPSPDYPSGKKGLSREDVLGFIGGCGLIILFVLALLSSVEII